MGYGTSCTVFQGCGHHELAIAVQSISIFFVCTDSVNLSSGLLFVPQSVYSYDLRKFYRTLRGVSPGRCILHVVNIQAIKSTTSFIKPPTPETPSPLNCPHPTIACIYSRCRCRQPGDGYFQPNCIPPRPAIQDSRQTLPKDKPNIHKAKIIFLFFSKRKKGR